jgi:hypothetical protein
MGSTGDRAASLMLEGREAGACGGAASSASCGPPPPANSITNEAPKRTAIEAVRTVGVCAAVALICLLMLMMPPLEEYLQNQGF